MENNERDVIAEEGRERCKPMAATGRRRLDGRKPLGQLLAPGSSTV